MKKLSQWWEKQTLSRKLTQVLFPSVVIGTVCIMIFLNFVFHVSFLNRDNDVTGWGSLLIGSAIGIYITFAILIYSNASQKKTNELIDKISDQQDQISSLVEDIKKIGEWQQNFMSELKSNRDARILSAHLKIAANLAMIIDFMYQAKILLISVEQGNNSKQVIKESIEGINNYLSGFIESTQTTIENSIDVLDPEFARKILTICHSKPHFDLESSSSQDYSSIKQLLKLVMNGWYPNYTRFQKEKYYQ